MCCAHLAQFNFQLISGNDLLDHRSNQLLNISYFWVSEFEVPTTSGSITFHTFLIYGPNCADPTPCFCGFVWFMYLFPSLFPCYLSPSPTHISITPPQKKNLHTLSYSCVGSCRGDRAHKHCGSGQEVLLNHNGVTAALYTCTPLSLPPSFTLSLQSLSVLLLSLACHCQQQIIIC